MKRKKKYRSPAQKKASDKNWLKARVEGALTLENVLDDNNLSLIVKFQIKEACEHLKAALGLWKC